MDGMRILQTYHIAGTLAANITPIFSAPVDMTLVAVSAVATNASSATLSVGTTASAAAYLAAFDIGDSSVPVVKSARTDFVGSEFPNINKGTIVQLTLDFDGAAGTAAQNVTVAVTYLEG